MKHKKFSLLLLIGIIIPLSSCSPSNKILEEIAPYVFDTGVYTKLDYDNADKYFEHEYFNWNDTEGGCSAISKVISNGHNIVGRNMDLNISNKPAYVVRTDTGKYKTLGLMYTFRDVSKDYKIIKEKGVEDSFYKLIPFMCDDVLNDQGLHIEINMRNGEHWTNGEDKFSCEGTNPHGERKVYMFEIPRYVGENCKSVIEAITYIKSLNVYSKKYYWNYAFLISDSSGMSVVVEFACNQVMVHMDHRSQTNFYLNETCFIMEDMRVGLGRYDVLQNGISSVDSKEDMYKLMKKVSYYQVYDIDHCYFDTRSEQIGSLKYFTSEFVMDPQNKPLIDAITRNVGAYVRSLSDEQRREENAYWQSTFTEVIDCNEKTIFVRFFEDDNNTLTLHF